MKAWKNQNLGAGIILCLFEVLVGILLLIDPIAFTSGILIAGGIILLVVGVVCLVRYFRADAVEAALSQSLTKSLVLLAAGLFLILKYTWFIATFPVLTILYGVAILVSGLGKIQFTVDMLRMKNKKWFWGAVSAVLSLVCAVVILSSPFASTIVLWKFTGIALIVEAVFDAVALFFRARGRRSMDGGEEDEIIL